MLLPRAPSAMRSGQILMSAIRLTKQNAVLEAAPSRLVAKRQAALLYPLCSSVQTRLQSTLPESKRPEPSKQQKQQKQQQKPLTKEEILLILRKGLDLRPFFKAIGTKEGFKKLYRQSPEELIVAIALYVPSQIDSTFPLNGIIVSILTKCLHGLSLAFISYGVVWLVKMYFTYFQSEAFTVFPPDVAQSLRRALYYTNFDPDPRLARKWYMKAIEQCQTHGIDRYKDEVIGIQLQVAAWLEGLEQYNGAIEHLEELFKACGGWVSRMEQYVRDGKIDNTGRLTIPLEQAEANKRIREALEKKKALPEGVTDPAVERELEYENLWAKRTRVMKWMVKIAAKLGELYADPHVLENDLAGERVIWAVETTLKELQRRKVEGVKEGEGDWFTDEEFGAELEQLGNHYETKSLFHLAAPAFLQAITLAPKESCHTAVLMNNLAISLAQQPAYAMAESNPIAASSPDAPKTAPPTRETLLESARQWALQAKATSERVQGENRTEECDTACAVALCNLGTIASMSGRKDDAKRFFDESLALSQKLEFRTGVSQAKTGLRMLTKAPKKSKAVAGKAEITEVQA